MRALMLESGHPLKELLRWTGSAVRTIRRRLAARRDLDRGEPSPELLALFGEGPEAADRGPRQVGLALASGGGSAKAGPRPGPRRRKAGPRPTMDDLFAALAAQVESGRETPQAPV